MMIHDFYCREKKIEAVDENVAVHDDEIYDDDEVLFLYDEEKENVVDVEVESQRLEKANDIAFSNNDRLLPLSA